MADQQTAELRNDLPRVVDGPSPIALFLLKGLCGAAVVVGMKALPDYYGMNLVAHPVATIQLSLVWFLEFSILMYNQILSLSRELKKNKKNNNNNKKTKNSFRYINSSALLDF